MNWKRLTKDLKSKKYIGCYGADHIAYHVLTDAKFNINISESALNYTPDENINQDLKFLIDHVFQVKINGIKLYHLTHMV